MKLVVGDKEIYFQAAYSYLNGPVALPISTLLTPFGIPGWPCCADQRPQAQGGESDWQTRDPHERGHRSHGPHQDVRLGGPLQEKDPRYPETGKLRRF